ncbi:hypothetical protein IFR05_010315 [Cadophora sp. M221]|nr:hypothetical protein IFR05_010315 [Cadophora sp. M221]
MDLPAPGPGPGPGAGLAVKSITVVFAGKRKASDISGPAKRARINTDSNIVHTYEEEVATMEKPSKRGPGRTRTTTIQSTATSSEESTPAKSRQSLPRARKSKSKNSKLPLNIITIHKEADALQGYPTPTGDINNLPSFLLDNVNVEAPPGVIDPEEAAFLRNIIHQAFKPGSNLKVTGLLTSVEDANKNRQIALFLHQYLELDNVRVISVGCTDDIRTCQLWLLGRAGWYEIRPKLEYRQIFEDMMKAIALKFFLDDWYYGLLSTRSENEIVDILLKCAAKVAGDGDNIAVWTARCKEYAPFLLSQMDDMDKEKGDSILKNSAMYKWLKEGAPPLRSDEGFLRTSPEPDPPHPIGYSTSSSQKSSGSGAKRKNSSPYHGPYTSKNWPRGAKDGEGFDVQVAALICHMVEKSRWMTDPETLNVNKIHDAIYRDFSVQWLVTCKMLVTYYSEAIAARLPSKFHKYAFYKELAKSSPDSALDRALDVYEKSKVRNRAAADRKANKIAARNNTDNKGDSGNVDREEGQELVARDDAENEGDGIEVDREDGQELFVRDDTENEGDGTEVDHENGEEIVAPDEATNERDGGEAYRENGEKIVAHDDANNEGEGDEAYREKEKKVLDLFHEFRLGTKTVRRRKRMDVSLRGKTPAEKASSGSSTPPNPKPRSKPAQVQNQSSHIHPDTLAIIQPTMGQQLVSAMTPNEFSKHIRARVKAVDKSYGFEGESSSTTDGEAGETVNRSEVQTSVQDADPAQGKTD